MKKILFWCASLTWGGIMTWLGAIIACAMILTGHKPKVFHYFVYFEMGEDWGGFEMGAFFFVNRSPTLHIKQHEAGHGSQNIIFGVFMPFIVSIPSAIRYWYRRFKRDELPPYDSIWFEGQATRLGKKYFN